MAVNMAAGQDRPVTARDTEDAVNELNNEIDASPVDAVPVFDGLDGIRVANADRHTSAKRNGIMDARKSITAI